VLFFAPDHAVALFKELGASEATRQITESWRNFLTSAKGAIAIKRLSGLAEARRVFGEMIAGKVDPTQGIVIEP
jgi:hypothetical protein